MSLWRSRSGSFSLRFGVFAAFGQVIIPDDEFPTGLRPRPGPAARPCPPIHSGPRYQNPAMYSASC